MGLTNFANLGDLATRSFQSRWFDALVILFSGVLVVIGGIVVAGSRPSEAIAYGPTSDVPVLSGRRLPDTVASGAGQIRLDQQLTDVVETSPATSCIAVPASAAGWAEGPADSGPMVVGNAGGLVPASLVKLLVTDATLAAFGPEHRFTTKVVASATPDANGSVVDLHLVGGGDPFLSTDGWIEFTDLPEARAAYTSLSELADMVVAAGVKHISGSVVGDSSYFNAPLGEGGPYLSPGPASALMVDEGVFQLPAEEDRLRFAPSRTTAVTMHAARAFRALLEERGVQVDGASAVGVHPAEAVDIAKISSATVGQLVTRINTFSSSIGAQVMLRHVGLEGSGSGTVEAGVEAVLDHLAGSGLPMDGVVLVDGTGLSNENRVTCRLIYELLSNAGPNSLLAESLAVSGTMGTAGQRFTNPEIRGLIRAKTGTVSESRAVAGFAASWADGRETPFVFIINQKDLDYDTFDPLSRRIQEDLLIALVQLPCLPDRETFERLTAERTLMQVVIEGPGAVASADPSVEVDPLAASAVLESNGDQTSSPPQDPALAGCDDGQPIHGVRIDSTFVELRYSPSCETMWAKASFDSLKSGVADLHLVGYSCPEAVGDCRLSTNTVRLDSAQGCINPLDESGTCLFASADQVWTEMMPASLANLRACISQRPSFFLGDDGDRFNADVCTDPAYQTALVGGTDRQLARTTSECRVVRETQFPSPAG